MKPEDLPSRKFRALLPEKHTDTINEWSTGKIGLGMKAYFTGILVFLFLVLGYLTWEFIKELAELL